jgi:NAD-dependent DNA ligase
MGLTQSILSIMKAHPDHQPYLRQARRQRIDTAVHTLEGILKGIAIDRHINHDEAKELTSWCDDYCDLIEKHPFVEIVPQINATLEKGMLDPSDQKDIVWVCQSLSAQSEFYDEITTDIQILQGVLHGVLADSAITTEEATQLAKWIEENEHLKGCYPYDELDSLLISVLKDGKIDEAEGRQLQRFFEDFISYSLSKRMRKAREAAGLSIKTQLPGICASCPEIEFSERVFCFTGASRRAVRRELTEVVIERGGEIRDSVTPDLHYLVVGAAGNPCWAFSCYGRKIEEAVSHRKNGHRLLIVHENDFWDAVEDSGLR